MRPLVIGDLTVQRVVESEGRGFFPAFLLPDATPAAIEAHAGWLVPHFYHPPSGRFVQSVHSFVVRTPRHVLLVDTCVGNHKHRPSSRAWHLLDTDWLARLAACGVHPAMVDYVLCTHLHVDHVGWNTRLVDGRWVPTFANARYIVHRREFEHWERERDMPPEIGYGRTEGSFEDSVLPVLAAGQLELVDDGFRFDDTAWLEVTPGHSPGHVCLHLGPDRSGGRAVCSGDLLHHPVQCAEPHWNSRYCLDGALARATRERFLDALVDTDTTVLAAHFAAPTAGHVRSVGGARRFVVDARVRGA